MVRPRPKSVSDFHRSCQTLPSVEQAPLDGSHGCVERRRHFDQRLAVHIERLQRSPIEILELIEPGADLCLGLVRHNALQWRNVVRAGDVQDLVVGRRHGPAPRDAIDAQPGRDRAQPTAHGGWRPQRTDLPHRLQEHILAQFLGLGIVARPPPAVGEYLALKHHIELTERLPIALLGGGHQRHDIGLRAQSRRGHEAAFRDRIVGFCQPTPTKRWRGPILARKTCFSSDRVVRGWWRRIHLQPVA